MRRKGTEKGKRRDKKFNKGKKKNNSHSQCFAPKAKNKKHKLINFHNSKWPIVLATAVRWKEAAVKYNRSRRKQMKQSVQQLEAIRKEEVVDFHHQIMGAIHIAVAKQLALLG